MKFLRRLWPVVTFGVLLLTYGVIWSHRDAIGDWVALRSYSPPANIVSLADQTTMTPLAKHYLYINHPLLADRDVFNKHCTNDTEQSVVLGCFTGNRNGIYVYNVTDPELNGVQQITTAHEMLHQAYDRLSARERHRVNQLLEDYYKTSLTDESVKSQIEEYKKSEPDALDNEMHSLFGTEVANLPAELENYYRQYFTDRSKVVGLYTQYQAAFTTRKAQIAEYDAQLASQKPEIEQLQSSLKEQSARIDAMQAELNQKRSAGDVSGYNALVAQYNTAISTYNSGVNRLKSMISDYNAIVEARNAIADQELHLQQSLSSKSVTGSTQQ